ncbi:MAG: RtcB family protein [Prevotella sp.]|nr:RtcB family protein [Prevotella sp.]
MSNLKIYCRNIEQTALEQIQSLTEHPVYSDVSIRIMPDAHAGTGCTVGTTIALADKVTPNLVGVDIGCGMHVVELGKVDVNPAELDRIINHQIPSGNNIRTEPVSECTMAEELIRQLKCFKSPSHWPLEYLKLSVGTLGGGNHFIELDKDDDGNVYLVIHSGSRKLGVRVCHYYQKMANTHMMELTDNRRELIARLKAEGRQHDIQLELAKQPRVQAVTTPLAYLEGDGFRDYLHDMDLCQRFAVLNRHTMARMIIEGLGVEAVSEWETIHNYIDVCNMILRKGAISAQAGERVIIPMNMRDGSLVCIGKGNPDWNFSAPHGAGRLMSRSQALESIDMAVFRHDMEGIASWSVCDSTRDEAPGVYKPMESIIEQVEPTVRIERIIRPKYNYKAH